MLDVKLVRTRQTNYPAVFAAINRNFLPKAGAEVLNETVRIIRDKDIIDKGHLRDSYRFKVSKDSVSVGTNLEYAPYVEYGTYKMKSRQHLRPALDNKRKFLVALWADTYNKVFRVLGGK